MILYFKKFGTNNIYIRKIFKIIYFAFIYKHEFHKRLNMCQNIKIMNLKKKKHSVNRIFSEGNFSKIYL